MAPTKPADRVRELRDRLGLTQHELARVLGVDKSTPSRWEQDVHTPPRMAIVVMEALFRAKEMSDAWRELMDEVRP